MNSYPTKGPGDFDPPDDDARDEWIAERAGDLVLQRRSDSERVREAIDTAMQNDEDDTFGSLLATLFDAVEAVSASDPRGDAAMAHAAMQAWRTLLPYVEAGLRDDAEIDADAEWGKREQADALARDEQQDVAMEANREW